MEGKRSSKSGGDSRSHNSPSKTLSPLKQNLHPPMVNEKEWYVPANAAKLMKYDADVDPYCPISRKKKLKKGMKNPMSQSTNFLNTEGGGSNMTNTSSKFDVGGFSSSMKQMERPLSAPNVQFPKHKVANTNYGHAGLTYSAETNTNTLEGKAELEVLKAILNREGYLLRLYKEARTVLKKFKPELADILDFIRAASLDVIEYIVKWRESKNDHDAAFMWNGVNYLLKMSSDLDYLSEYVAIKKWMGFRLIRNPFCVPTPLEEGCRLFSDKVLNPLNIETGRPTDGFTLGGITQTKMKNKYSPAPLSKHEVALAQLEKQAEEKSGIKQSKASPYGAVPLAPSKALLRQQGETGSAAVLDKHLIAGFVLNEDMMKIRQCELVILKEEEKFGKHSRDPEGHVVPEIQAKTRIASLELRKDDKRPITEASTTIASFAPHAHKSVVGVADPPWAPEVPDKDKLLHSKLLENIDSSVIAHKRGEGKLGGVLAPLDSKGTESRVRRPLNPSLGSEIEFQRHRRKKTLAERLLEISDLKQKLVDERNQIELEAKKQAEIDKANQVKLNASLGRSGREKSSKKKKRDKSANKSDSENEGGLTGTTPPASPSRKSRPSSKQQPNNIPENEEVNIIDDKLSSPTEKKKKKKKKVDETSESENELVIPIIEPEMIVSDHGVEEIKELEEEEHYASSRINSIIKDESRVNVLKDSERLETSKLRSRDIERKRRKLTEEEGLIRGPPVAEPHNGMDYFAMKIQTTIRAWLARCFVGWYKEASRKATTKIQAGIRGWLGRLRVKRRKIIYRACTNITRVFRGWKTRGTSAKLAGQKNLTKNVVFIQRIWRGALGKMRCLFKKELDLAALEAKNCVDPKSLFLSDVQELGRRIQNAIEEPLTTKYPPDEVLHVIRLSIMIIQGSRGLLGLSSYNIMNKRSYKEVNGEDLTWTDASKMINRSERLLRIVRNMAFGPSTNPPRLIQIPTNAVILYDAQQFNPLWCLETFETMGMGSKFCCQLFKWVRSMLEVAKKQVKFLLFLTSNYPDWLPKLYEMQQAYRASEFETSLNDRCIETLKMYKERAGDDFLLDQALAKEILILTRNNETLNNEKEQLLKTETIIKADQIKREKVLVMAMDLKVKNLVKERKAVAKRYAEASLSAANGDRLAISELPELRVQLIELELTTNELESQNKLALVQIEKYEQLREKNNRLPADILLLVINAGEARAVHILAGVKMQVMLKDAGVKFPKELLPSSREKYEKLENDEEATRLQSKTSFQIAKNARVVYDANLTLSLRDTKTKQEKGNDYVVPTDQEMQEERFEDEKEAVSERLKVKQFLPDSVNKPHMKRPRPVVVALARDLPGYIKKRIHSEILKLMPGLFITLDTEKNTGLDVKSMQAVLDSGHSIIMSVDHGLTRLTRLNFIKNFDMCIHALIPNPFVVLAMGDEANRRVASGDPYFGVYKSDLNIMKDCDIKSSLEGMGMVIYEMQREEVAHHFQMTGSQIKPSSLSLVLVLEAIFVLLSTTDDSVSPDTAQAAASWRVTHTILLEPLRFAKKLKEIRRGRSSLRKCECLNQYLLHPHWPEKNSTLRSTDPTLNLLAVFCETWLVCEKKTIERGGMPKQGVSKAAMKGMHTVVICEDGIDPEDYFGETLAGWRMPVAKLVRSTLQDLRILKIVHKIEGKPYNITVFREEAHIFINAYDPDNSREYLCMVKIDDVPGMLMPNAFSINAGTAGYAPITQQELAMRLIKLLRFSQLMREKGVRKILICKREYQFLRNFSTKLDGHRVLIKCYEAALGELYFTAYIYEYSANITFHLEEVVRLDLCDKCDMIEEKHIIEAEDARILLPFMMDRLRITPSLSCVQAKGIVGYEGFHKIKDEGLMSLAKTQGFKLKLRVRGGAGRAIMKKVLRFCNVPHLVQIRSCTQTKVLRILAYEPIHRHQMEIRVSGFVRRFITGTDDDNIKLWYKTIKNRIKINWRGNHKLSFDSIMYKSVRKITGRQLIIEYKAIDENEMEVIITDLSVNLVYSMMVSKDNLIRLLHFVPTPDAIKKEFGTTIKSTSVSGILKNMIRGPVVEGVAEIFDPSLLAMTMIEVFSIRENFDKLTSNIQYVLKRRDVNQILSGYYADEPVDLLFIHVPRSMESLSLDTSLMYKNRLVQSERGYSLDEIIKARKQVPILDMDIELNNLALRRKKESQAKKESDLKLAIEFDDYIDTIEEDKDVEDATDEAVNATASGLLESVEIALANRMVERATPGITQEVKRTAWLMMAGDGKTTVEVDDELLSGDQRAILGKGEVMVSETGIKTTFRDGSHRWHGHVSIQVFETVCWMGDEFGAGRRLRFSVFDPESSLYFEGTIRNSKQLREILGKFGGDLYDKRKTSEMILYIAKYRMYLKRANRTEDGLDIDETAPLYVLEFESDRLYDATKVTPVNAGEEEDEEANAKKLFELEKLRGKKLSRIARRISGLLMQLTVFEVADDEEEEKKTGDGWRETGEEREARLIKEKERRKKIAHDQEQMDKELDDRALMFKRKEVSDDVEIGPADKRSVTRIPVFEAPTLRVIGYDPGSRRKVSFIASPALLVEIAGGIYSPFLDPGRRRELAKVLCESLLLVFPRGKPFELVVPWSGAPKVGTTALAGAKNSTRSSSERVIKRPGKIFRSAMRISNIDVIVTIYSLITAANEKQIVCNFYARAASESTEVVLTEKEQIDRINGLVMSFTEGIVRATALRRLCKFFMAQLEEDPEDSLKKILIIDLLNPSQDFIGDYHDVGVPRVGENIRPIGVPSVFMPLDTCGIQIHRRGMTIMNQDKKLGRKDYIVTVYTKDNNSPPEKGLVIKMYERGDSETAILHLGSSELIRLCEAAGEIDLIRDMVYARKEVDEEVLDEVEMPFISVTTKGDKLHLKNKLVNYFIDIVLAQIGVKTNPQLKIYPYIKNAKRGLPPT